MLRLQVSPEARDGEIEAALAQSTRRFSSSLAVYSEVCRRWYELAVSLTRILPGVHVIVFVFSVLVKRPTRSKRIARMSSAACNSSGSRDPTSASSA
eukprot:CAMPEP_0172572226 /NCGR_PEP_ID=MMETSP1067-20121228/134356_1 /TAXON_ID=265564 ORGANISM="Thalassiosira punctigera, Strain Tpunct2005C2" /NCGR_SAMPLE_ID=MMETSP1067 /ASSEMBLY_ACC=CAM_ASM_000444 /LENGTH=96 /DNA_ID=CAMNT_0013364723 /DNA_START=297 /DNA_END=588 /DNA_ORIENTATION=+